MFTQPGLIMGALSQDKYLLHCFFVAHCERSPGPDLSSQLPLSSPPFYMSFENFHLFCSKVAIHIHHFPRGIQILQILYIYIQLPHKCNNMASWLVWDHHHMLQDPQLLGELADWMSPHHDMLATVDLMHRTVVKRPRRNGTAVSSVSSVTHLILREWQMSCLFVM